MKITHSLHTYLLIVAAVVGISIISAYREVTLVIGNLMHDTTWYIGIDEGVVHYNESIFLAREGKYLEAKSELALLINNDTIGNPAEVNELYGDLVLRTGGSSGDILPFYRKSLTYRDSSRVSLKIAYLEQLSGGVNPIKPDRSSSTTDHTSSSSGSSGSSWSQAGEIKQKELQTLQSNRAGLVNYNINTSQDIQDQAREILGVLEGKEEKKDW